jgi:hypothetical protein
MAHKKKIDKKKESLPYKIEDAMKITDEIFNLSKERKYNVGAFVHGLIFALEYTQISYNIPHQQIAGIKRDCRRYFTGLNNINK